MSKILVIDDERGTRNLLDILLSEKGYDVVLADGGRTDWRFFAENIRMSLCRI